MLKNAKSYHLKRINYFRYSYQIASVKLKQKNDVNIKCNNHYKYLTSEAYKSSGFLIRNSKYFEINTIVQLYNALVRPQLEYALIIWSPIAETRINQIEKITITSTVIFLTAPSEVNKCKQSFYKIFLYTSTKACYFDGKCNFKKEGNQ